MVVYILYECMRYIIPLCCEDRFKRFWTDKIELNELKHASVEAYSLWYLCDKPRSGLVSRLRLDAKYKYKIALKTLWQMHRQICVMNCLVYVRVKLVL